MNEQFSTSQLPYADSGVFGPTRRPPTIVRELNELIRNGHRFQTVLADPPWRYENTASRAAAENHYQTMSVDEICRQPIEQLVEADAHLHLWTTNAFLESAFNVMRAWGFEFRSCMVWVKPTIGMGNYYRVSHEFLLFGIRGTLPFGRNDVPSWLMAPRSVHSRNPSTLEQRTGRVDRIGAKAEFAGRPIHIYIPFIAETQDEKMYRVVMDREPWFNVVMGEDYKIDVQTTEKLANRVTFPVAAATELAFDLGIVSSG